MNGEELSHLETIESSVLQLIRSKEGVEEEIRDRTPTRATNVDAAAVLVAIGIGFPAAHFARTGPVL